MADSLNQVISFPRGATVVIPFAPETATAAPAALAFVVAAEPEGEPLFDELTVGDGITITDAPDGEFTVTIPAEITSEIPAGEYIWSLWDRDTGSEDEYAAGTLRVRASARVPG